MSIGRLQALTSLGLLLCSATLQAQAVRGALVDRGSGRPIEGAFVTLLNEAGSEVARALTSLGGTFLLRAPLPGTYRLRSKRIGFRLTESPPLALADSQTLEYRLEVEAVPVRLPAVIVRGRPQCGAKAEEAAAVAELWEEASEALAAVKWTQDRAALRYTVEMFDRTLPRMGRQVLAERDSAWSGAGRKLFGSVPAEQLARDGYVVAAPDDSVDYYAPDADVLLGELFVNTHCFSVQDGGPDNPGLVGLAFEPEPRRKLPDIAGVLWLDRQTLELRVLGFSYTRLRDNSLGGRVEFAPLSSGPWIVTHWWIRTPLLDRGPRRGMRRPPLRLMGYRESGGMVTAILSPAGAVQYWGRKAILEGTVVDSSRGEHPLSGAVVSLVGTKRLVLADEGGRFEITGPFDAVYGVSFQHPRLDSLGISADQQRVTLARGVRQTLTLFVPPESVVVRRLCPKGLRPDHHVIVGVVRDSTFAPVPHAQVDARLGAGEAERAARADSAGRFVICNVPAEPLTLSAASGGASSAVVVEFKEGGVWADGTQFHAVTGRVWKQDILLGRSARAPSQ